MMKPDYSSYRFAAVMDYPTGMPVLDLSEGFDPRMTESVDWAIGRYNEKRRMMYLAPQYEGRRNIHMGIDIWSDPGKPVYAFYRGEIAYLADHREPGNYGPTLVTRHRIGSETWYALHGHLSASVLHERQPGENFETGELLAVTGTEVENGGWAPHLHFQLSTEDPGEADMPGVVSGEDHRNALRIYPDPRIVLGELYG